MRQASPGGPVPPPASPASGGAAPAPGSAVRPSGIGFRLDNADLLQFVNLVASELKLNYVVDPAVKGQVTISTSGDLKHEDLLPILETVLKMNNATLIKLGNFYRIAPLSSGPKNPMSISTSLDGAHLPADDRVLMQIVPLKFVVAGDMQKLLTPFLSETGTMAVYDAGNTLILVDDSLNIKRLLEILEQFDNSSFSQQRIWLLEVSNNLASALVPELQAIFATYALSDKDTPIRFVPLDRINGILVAAADPVAVEEVRKWVEKLDRPAPASGTQTFVYRVQNSEAGYLVRLLNALRGVASAAGSDMMGRGTNSMGSSLGSSLGGGAMGSGSMGSTSLGGGFGSGRGGSGFGGGMEQQSAPVLPGESTGALSALGATGGPQGVVTAQPRLRIITDPVSNSVIVQGTAQEYAEIAQTLEKLDVLPRQVMIEARVYEVNLNGSLSYGLEYALQNKSSSTTAPYFLGDYGVSSASALTGSYGMGIDSVRNLVGFLTASENHNRVRTLSAPTLLTTDSTEARIQVGESVPVLTSQGLVAGAQAGSNSLFTSTVNNVDTGIILTVTPRITSNGLVSLQINQEISNEVPPASTGIQSPSFTKRSVTTHAVAQDGQTIALGGLISYQYSKVTNRVPLLGDIPFLGAFFGSTSYTTTETELIVLLTPRIIATRPAANTATRELKEKLKDLQREFKKDRMGQP
jgi:general secretion pathway protein D